MDALAPDDFILDVTSGPPSDVLVLRRGVLPFDPPIVVDDLARMADESLGAVPVDCNYALAFGVSARFKLRDDLRIMQATKDALPLVFAFARLYVTGDEVRARVEWTLIGREFWSAGDGDDKEPPDPLWLCPLLTISSDESGAPRMAILSLSVLTRPPCFGKNPPPEVL